MSVSAVVGSVQPYLCVCVCVSVLKGGERLEKKWLGWLVGGAKKPEVRI